MSELLRNEVDIELGGGSRTMRANFVAIRSIERETGKSVIALIDNAQGLSVTETAIIVHHGLRGSADTRLKSVEETGELIVEQGFDTVAVSVINFLAQSLSGASLGKPQAVEKP